MKNQINELFEGALVIGLAAFFAAALFSATQSQASQPVQVAKVAHTSQHA
ncbi:hypothetical protein [Chitinimonas naiadis]